MSDERLARAAEAYAAHGWKIFPIKPRTKVPLTDHGLNDATTDADQVMEWWDRWGDANIGVSCGPSQLLVIDLDGYAGPASWAALEEQHGPAGDTLTARTGSGGLHLIYATAAPTRNSASKLGPSIDTRGDGGYIVAAPSLHASGQRYTWLNRGAPAPAPAWLERLTAPPVPATRPTGGLPPAWARSDPDATAYGRGALERILSELASTPNGSRNHQLNVSAFACGRLASAGHLNPHACTAALEHAALSIGLEPRETTATIRSGLAAGAAEGPPANAPRIEPHHAVPAAPRSSTAPEIRAPQILAPGSWR